MARNRTRGWHESQHVPAWQEHLGHLSTEPTTYLEIGVFEGASMEWMAENILQHPESRGIGLDPWQWDVTKQRRSGDEIYQLARQTLADYPKVELVRAFSRDHLASGSIKPGSVTVAYIDGSHLFQDCYTDSLLVWPLLAPGGFCIWDDHANRGRFKQVVNAVGLFLQGLPDMPEQAWKTRRQIAFRKAGAVLG